jgi:hypothetical protein
VLDPLISAEIAPQNGLGAIFGPIGNHKNTKTIDWAG